ncbi:class I SAM-dependent methyltransferase [Clostridium sp. PL3]|uniref:Class I SAM-dependent methyltransferase n=1 Tax=Clostridium thailandense TaxID=2794346 RepID=A0A949WTD9_9CLOT|nr:class I SAM-dependent methyltransferase [Clostridium thailandense]MBV7276215.1 class I SAM-dependent methyltransferase [Clostridium thailandense]
MLLQENIERYWTQSSNNYSNIIKDELKSYRPDKWRSLILSQAPDKLVLDILDTGTGPGFFAIILSQAGHRVTGIDSAAGMLEKAQKNSARAGVCPVFIRMDCHNLNFEDNSFDMIVSRNVTWTLHDPMNVYRQWQRILRPGGRLLIFDANWNLHYYDEELRKEVERREKECISIYGSTYSGDDKEKMKLDYDELPLCKTMRPDWDVKALTELGFKDISFNPDITKELWDDKEKLLYGASPMFMVTATKE